MTHADPSATRTTDPIIGIDLGTTNSLSAIHDAGGPRVLGGDRAIVPSVVRYEQGPDGTVRTVVGEDAREQAVAFPRSTVSSVKRLMGRGLGDVAAEAAYLSFDVIPGEHDTARVGVLAGDTPIVLTPQEVSATILREVRTRAEAELGHPVSRAVVTVPAYFDDAQRQATRDAGRIAGIEVVRIVNEPTAAALAYGLGLARDAARNAGIRHIAVYDLGGGTFDVSILRITPAAPSPAPTTAPTTAPSTAQSKAQSQSDGDAKAGAFYQVLATAGDTRLGGDDFDNALVRTMLDDIAQRFGISPDLTSLPPATRRALARFARDIKHRLSTEDAAAVSIDLGEGRAYERTITRAEFEAMIEPLVARSFDACRRALQDAEKHAGGSIELDAAVLVGGSTRVPIVRERAHAFFGIEPYTALDPDRVVAMGAAVQAGLLSGAASGSLLLDVIPLSLGIETRGGAVAKLIPANSAVPARATETFSTSVDGQVSIKLNVVQGEREMAEDCRSLGEFHLAGLPPMPAGIPQLEVEFLVDANGVLRVGAHEKRSGKRATLQVVPNHGLTEDEVARIEAESIEHARDDMTRHRIVDLITNARLDMKWIGERLDRHRADLESGYAADLDAKLATLRDIADRAEADWRSVDADAFARAKDELDRASVRLQEVGIAASLRADDSAR